MCFSVWGNGGVTSRPLSACRTVRRRPQHPHCSARRDERVAWICLHRRGDHFPDRSVGLSVTAIERLLGLSRPPAPRGAKLDDPATMNPETTASSDAQPDPATASIRPRRSRCRPMSMQTTVVHTGDAPRSRRRGCYPHARSSSWQTIPGAPPSVRLASRTRCPHGEAAAAYVV